MTSRDRRWRALGAVLLFGAYGLTHLTDEGSPSGILFFIAGACGVLLLLQGKRVAVVWQAQRHGHCDTAEAIHAGRVRRRQRGT